MIGSLERMLRSLLPLALLVAAAPVHGLPVHGQPGDGQEGVELIAPVEAVLTTHCIGCHTPETENVRARRSFDGAADLARVKDELVSPGDPDFSDLWFVIEDGSMPPDDSEYGPLDGAERDAVHAWILAGAPLPEAPSEEPTDSGQESTAGSAKPDPPVADPAVHDVGPPSKLAILVRRLHPVLVHFPIALLLTAFLAEVLQGRGRRSGLEVASRLCVWIGALAGAASAYSGWGLAEDVTQGDLLEQHRWFGGSAAALGLLALLFTELYGLGKRPRWRLPLRITLFIAAVVVGLAGHLGGSLVYGEDWFTP